MFCGFRECHDHDATFRGEVNFDEAPQIFTAREIANQGPLALKPIHGGAVEFNAGQFIQPIHRRLLVSINLVEKLQFGRRKFRIGLRCSRKGDGPAVKQTPQLIGGKPARSPSG